MVLLRSNLIGSLSRTTKQYSPPREWIMCELGVFPIFLENDLLKVDKILGLTFFKARKDFEGFKMAFFHWVLCSMDCLQLPLIRVEETVSCTQRFPTRKIWPKNRGIFMTSKFESKFLQKFYVSSKQGKEYYRKTKSYLEQLSSHFCQHFMWRTTQQTFLTINLASQQKTTKLYFSSQLRKQLKLLTVPFKPLRCCLRSDKLVNCHVWKFCKDLFLNLRVIWSVNEIVLFNGFLSDFVEITSRVYILKQLFFQSR